MGYALGQVGSNAISGAGVFFTLLVAVTKIEQNNRYLPLERVPGPALLYRVNTIDLLR